MTKLRPGARVIVTEPIRRGRGHPHGQAKVRRGAKAHVVGRHVRRRHGRLVPLRRFRTVTYDIDVDDGLRAQYVPAVSASAVRRSPRLPARRLVVVAILVLVVVRLVAERVV
jgi:hypothetical protein